jgi:hypothetical protein
MTEWAKTRTLCPVWTWIVYGIIFGGNMIAKMPVYLHTVG